MNCTKKYSNKMGGVGIADNPRNYYRIYFGVRKRKLWCVVVILTNAYIYTYALITWTVLQGNIYYLILVLKGNSMCMDKSGKIQCREIWSLARHLSSYKENKIRLAFMLLGANNDTRQSTTRINYHQNHHNLKKKQMLMTITWPLMGT